ncbi:MAG: hypothetical protein ABII27_04110 [bacterium]
MIIKIKSRGGVMRVFLILGIFMISGCQSNLFWSEKNQKAYINQLVDNGLYKLAAEEYENLATKSGLSDQKKANIFYLAGNIYIEKLGDNEKALSCFLKAKILEPPKGLLENIEKKTILCLERMGKSFDAQKKLDQLASAKPQKIADSKDIVARIGNKNITMEELENEIRNLPAYLQSDYSDNKKKLEFLKQYIATELMYDSAKRRQYDEDTELKEKLDKLKKSLMVQKLIEEEVAGKVTVTDEEVKYYYEANKKAFVDEKNNILPLNKIRDKVKLMIQSEKEQSHVNMLLENLMQTKKVEIYENVFNTEDSKK